MLKGPSVPFVSIIVPCRIIDLSERECIEGCLRLEYPSFEVIVLPDHDQGVTSVNGPIKVVSTGPVRPGVKRNMGLDHAKGELIAFIDSDAFPDRAWLTNAAALLGIDSVAIAGGPSLTPGTDTFRQKVGGMVLASWFGAGSMSSRYRRSRIVEVDDLPTSNFVVRRSVLEKMRGSLADYWPGEDTFICRMVKTLGMRSLYSPNVVVYHHRRPLFKAHLRQIWSYGLHRGYFAKKYPENSRRPVFFVPSAFLVGLMGGFPLSLLNIVIFQVYGLVLSVYAGLCMIEGLRTRNLKAAIYVPVGIFLSHVTYGAAFLKGLLSRHLGEDSVKEGIPPSIGGNLFVEIEQPIAEK